MKSTKTARSQMVRLDSDLWEWVGKHASTAGRTPRQEIERRLRESLTKASDDRLSPARAMGRLVELMAGDLASYAQSANEWQSDMKTGVSVLANELFSGSREGMRASQSPKQDGDRSFAEAAARALAQKVLRAHLPTMRTGDPMTDHWADEADRHLAQAIPSLGRLHQEELLKIQKALGLSPDTAPLTDKPRSRKKETGHAPKG